MPRRFTVVAFLCLGLLLAPSDIELAFAHRLMAKYRLLPGYQIQLESWFDISSESAKSAEVLVYRQNGELLTKGSLNDKGVFVFEVAQIETLRIVISAAGGHRAEVTIAARELRRAWPDLPEPAKAEDAEPFADRSPTVAWQDVLLGITFVLALAAFVMSMRNAQALRQTRNGNLNQDGPNQ
ncbi:MAG: hypothetical protein KatS3mg105_3380 [Gemmatales bacterium]|nr:MAG: hypothetical protein KatS3mg105_3380 [Gemmatales bacterium]